MNKLQEKWNELKTVPDDQLDQLIAGWEKCLTGAQPSFLVYKRQDELAAAELGLEFLGGSYQDVLNQTLIDLDVSRSKSKESPEAPGVGSNDKSVKLTIVTP